VGFDTPRPLGSGEAGGRVAAPVAADFLGAALETYSVAPFRVPDGVSLAPIDRETGEPSVIGRPGVILEAFKPGTEPQRGQTDAEETLSFGANALGVDFSSGAQDDADDDDDDEDALGGLY
jgi:penicillin-binding protein 1A